MIDLSEYTAYLNRQIGDVAIQFATPDPVATYNEVFTEAVSTFYSGTKVETRGLGSGFIIGDLQYGKIGSNLSPQPFLGNAGGGAYTVLVHTSQGSSFLNCGRTQVRDWLIGSSAAVSPTQLSLGSGIGFTWNGSLTALQNWIVDNSPTKTSHGVQFADFISTINSAALPILGSEVVGSVLGSSITGSTFNITSGVGLNNGSIVVYNGSAYNVGNGSNFTLEGWFNFSDLTTTKIPISNLNVAQGDGWEMQIVSPNINITGWASATQSWAHDLSLNTWCHLAFVKKPGSMLFFRNGSLVKTNVGLTDNAGINNDSNLIIGGRNSGTLQWTGSVDELRISDTNRYSTTFTLGSFDVVSDANTLGLWHFNEGTGSKTADASSKAKNGSLWGGYLWGTGIAGSFIGSYTGSYDNTYGNVLGSNFSEIGISGGKLYSYDTFPLQTVGNTGSEIRFTATIAIGCQIIYGPIDRVHTMFF